MNRGIRQKSDSYRAFVLDQEHSVRKVVDMLLGLVQEHGPDLAFAAKGPEIALVHNLLRIALEAGGSVALDAVARRLQKHLDRLELDPEGDAMATLARRVEDVGGRA
jgi:hypothetical protein